MVDSVAGHERLSPEDEARLSAPIPIEGFAGAEIDDDSVGADAGGSGAASSGMADMQDGGMLGEQPDEDSLGMARRERRGSIASAASHRSFVDGSERGAGSGGAEGSVAEGDDGDDNRAGEEDEDKSKQESGSPWLQRFRRLLVCFSLVHTIEHHDSLVARW